MKPRRKKRISCTNLVSLSKYQSISHSYQMSHINNIVYNEVSNIVATFKDNLILTDNTEFLKRFYNPSETAPRLQNYFRHYAENSVVFPNYTAISEAKYFYKNIQRKQKLIDKKTDNANCASFSSVLDSKRRNSIVNEDFFNLMDVFGLANDFPCEEAQKVIAFIDKAERKKHKKSKTHLLTDGSMTDKDRYVANVLSKSISSVRKSLPSSEKKARSVSRTERVVKEKFTVTQINLITNINLNYKTVVTRSKSNKKKSLDLDKSKEKSKDKSRDKSKEVGKEKKKEFSREKKKESSKDKTGRSAKKDSLKKDLMPLNEIKNKLMNIKPMKKKVVVKKKEAPGQVTTRDSNAKIHERPNTVMEAELVTMRNKSKRRISDVSEGNNAELKVKKRLRTKSDTAKLESASKVAVRKPKKSSNIVKDKV